ncbi:hypothetical protein BS17DRAFT_708117, partial [Gyrodon lividus]
NIVIFGGSGVGKSSLTNMLAGSGQVPSKTRWPASLFVSNRRRIIINGKLFDVWETAGLDEGTHGGASAEVVEKRLAKLLRELDGANGVHLLVYCICGASVRKALERNYTIFYSAICRKKVPIVAVVTGLENELPSMEDWWIKGEMDLAKYKMRFDDHACVTTVCKGSLVPHLKSGENSPRKRSVG